MSVTGKDDSEQVHVGQKLAAVITAGVGLTAAITLLGYLAGLPDLVRARVDWQSMSLPTALLCLGLAASLILDASNRYRAAARVSMVVLLGSSVIFATWLLTGHDAISAALTQFRSGWPVQSQTSEATALCAGLLAAGTLRRPRSQPAALLSITVMLITGLAVLGYAYGVKDLYALYPFRTMSLRTALSLFALALGFLLTNNESGVTALILDRSLTGRTTRRQLGFLVVPPIAAYLLLRATYADRLGPGAAMALLVMLTVAPLAALILRDAKALTRLDSERREKHRSETAQLNAERRYRMLFERLETGFCVIELIFDNESNASDYRFMEVNPAFVTQTGLTNADGRRMRELVPDHEQHWFDTYGHVALTGESMRFEHEAAALGFYYDVLAFRIDEPEARHVAVLFNDISPRRRSELDLKALNDTLERRVAERAAALDKAQDALRQAQKLEAIGQLTGGVAHDFNNLLTVIQGSVDLLRRPKLTDERRTRVIEAIGEAASRATKLTSQLLSFARRQALVAEIFNIGDSLKEVMGIVRTLTGSRITIDLRIPDDPCFVLADRLQFDTAIVNMAINARDAMNREGRIGIACGPVSGIPATRAHPPVAGDFIAVAITDTGTGISDENISRIFEPFFTTKDIGTGTGLGLSQVIGFAKQSGGDVRVDSHPGEGSTFTIYLRRELDTLPEPAHPGEINLNGEGLRVLVVEDNADVGDFATQSLKDLGYDSVLAADAGRALAVLAEDHSRFDIVFSDVVMPGMNGLDMAREIRKLYPSLPVVLTSGYSHVLAENGNHGFELLHKPYSVEQLSRVLRKVKDWAVIVRLDAAAEDA